MGYAILPAHSQRSHRSRSPLAMGGHVFQRAALLLLVVFLAAYTVVEYYSTRHVLAQCMDLTTYGTFEKTQAIPSTGPDVGPAIVWPEDEQDDEDKDGITVEPATTQPLDEKSPKIGKVTMLYGPPAEDETAQLIIDGHRRHAELNGHSVYVLDQQILHGLWSKHAYLLSIMLEQMQKPEDKRTQWLSWFDSDIIVMNPNVPLDIFLPPEKDFGHVDLMFTNDHNGLNNGAFFIRVSEKGVRFLVDCLALHTFRPEVKLKYSEQSAMEVMASDVGLRRRRKQLWSMLTTKQAKYVNKTMIVPQRWFNAYRGPRNEQGRVVRGQKMQPNSIKPGDLQLHFAGKKTTKLLMPKWVDLAANESSGWAIPLEKTKLKSEIALFWKLEKEKNDWDTPVTPKKSASTVMPSQEAPSATLVPKPSSSSIAIAGSEAAEVSGEGDASEDSSGDVPLAVEGSSLTEQDHTSEEDGQ